MSEGGINSVGGVYGASGPTNPYHIARAYAIQPASPLSAVSAVDRSSPVAAASAVRQELPSFNNEVSSIRRLLAGQVPGRVDFSGDEPAPSLAAGGSLPIYRNPTERNTAATGVAVGRVLDVNG